MAPRMTSCAGKKGPLLTADCFAASSSSSSSSAAAAAAIRTAPPASSPSPWRLSEDEQLALALVESMSEQRTAREAEELDIAMAISAADAIDVPTQRHRADDGSVAARPPPGAVRATSALVVELINRRTAAEVDAMRAEAQSARLARDASDAAAHRRAERERAAAVEALASLQLRAAPSPALGHPRALGTCAGAGASAGAKAGSAPRALGLSAPVDPSRALPTARGAGMAGAAGELPPVAAALLSHARTWMDVAAEHYTGEHGEQNVGKALPTPLDAATAARSAAPAATKTAAAPPPPPQSAAAPPSTPVTPGFHARQLSAALATAHALEQLAQTEPRPQPRDEPPTGDATRADGGALGDANARRAPHAAEPLDEPVRAAAAADAAAQAALAAARAASAAAEASAAMAAAELANAQRAARDATAAAAVAAAAAATAAAAEQAEAAQRAEEPADDWVVL
ncbi:hypothetical protein KFE25_009837 [Diacronema lutheri]|uniref:Uncharacterized protein n=1 Tax=Diacronema lutheri TaxID=2081491 RepID=A0A8J6C423_DIALT|nr:hypothetical protein KFE25_009837 [Diacronema lutheri]